MLLTHKQVNLVYEKYSMKLKARSIHVSAIVIQNKDFCLDLLTFV